MGFTNGNIEFTFIYSKDAIKIKSFLCEVPRNIECINYMDIFNKLAKNDYYQHEPSDAVVSSYLMRQLQNSVSKDTTRSIYYVLGNLNENTIKGIMSYVESLTNKSISYQMFHTPDVNVNGTAKLFNEVVEFDYE